MDSLFQFYPTNKDLNKYTYHKAHHQIPTSSTSPYIEWDPIKPVPDEVFSLSGRRFLTSGFSRPGEGFLLEVCVMTEPLQKRTPRGEGSGLGEEVFLT